MTSERWQRVKRLFEAALDQPPAACDAFLEAADESPSIVAEVRALLDRDAKAGQAQNFLAYAALMESAAEMLSPGDLVGGQFRIVSVLGKSGMGIVYQAEDTVLSRMVALKFLPAGLAGTTHGLERLKREARAAAALNHPNICVVYEIGEHPADNPTRGQPFIVMELLDGRTLQHRIGNQPLGVQELLDWAVQIAEGLEAAHQAGIAHRDIKPANIFITSRGQAKILDFGLAKTATPSAPAANPGLVRTATCLTLPGAMIGTVPYMSPEQARGEALDARSDLFSFGVVLYEMATGKRAFAGATDAIVYAAVLARVPPPPSTVNARIPRGLDRIIGKALEKDRDLRYRNAADLLADLKRVKEGSAPRLPRPAIRKATLAATGAIAVIAVLAVLAGWIWLHRTAIPGDHHEIVLADFENSTGGPEFDNALNTALAIDLKQSPFLLIASASKREAGLRLMERSPREKLTSALAREVCQRINDQAVLSGAIARFGQKYLVTLTASDCATGADLAQSKAVSSDRDGVLKAVDSVAAEMRERLGEPLKTLARFNKPLLVKMTGSLDALKAYTRGHVLAEDDKYRESIPLYQRAIELDPRFAVAYADLGVIYGNLNEYDLSAANCKRAYELRDLADEPDRLFIIATYHDHVTGDLHEGIRNYETWTEIYPDHATPWASLASLQIQIGRPDLAIAPAAKAVAREPVPIAYVILARAQLHAGQTNQALATCQRAIAQKADDAELHGLLMQLAFSRRDSSAVAEQIDWAKGKSDEPYMRLQAALMDFAQGRRRAALEKYRQTIDECKKQGMLERANRVQGTIPRKMAEFGLIDEARTLLHNLPPINGSTDIPVATAEVGEASQAEAIVRREMQKLPDDTLWQNAKGPLILGAIALARGKPEEAIEAMRPGLPYDMRDFDAPAMRGLAYLSARQPDLAAIEFHKIVDHPTVEPLSAHLPLAHLGLARVYALQGDIAGSVNEYEKFFELWKDADTDLPVLKDARLEFARLR